VILEFEKLQKKIKLLVNSEVFSKGTPAYLAP